MAQLDSGITVYDINKQGMDMYDPLDVIAINVKVAEMAKEIYSREGSLKYWMLLSNENRDYTVFLFKDRDNISKFKKEFVETLVNRGDVLEIEKQENNSYEIWIREKFTHENKVYYFFDYNFGIIEI